MKESKTKMSACSICGVVHESCELTELDGKFLCPECVIRETAVCSRCVERIWYTENSGDSNTILCQSCYDEYYTYCCECDRVILRDEAHYDGDEPLCYRCYEGSRTHDYIEDYYYKPDPIFYGDGSRFFGVELEIDEAGESDSSASSVMDIANSNGLEHIYCKHDGSLSEGFEIVTHPMTLDYHLNEMPWESMLRKIRSLGYVSHQAGTCGLHVHVNRSSLGDTFERQEETIARILFFFEKHWEELLKFSRRTNRQLEQWAAR